VHLRDRGLRRPLIVTAADKALAALPVMKHFVAHLDNRARRWHLQRRAGQSHRGAGDGGAGRLQGAPEPTAWIGFGGGAALDVAKVVALMAVHDGHVMEYVWDHPQ